MESVSLCLTSSRPFTTRKATKALLTSLHPRASLPTTISNSTPLTLLSPLLLSPSLPCLAAEIPDQTPDKINIESIVIAIDDFNNRNPFFVAGVTFIWLVVIPLVKAYLRKYKYTSAIDAFRRLRDDPSADLLDIRDEKSLAFLGSPNLKMLNKGTAQIHYSEADEDGFVNKVMERFPDPPNTVLCILDKRYKKASFLHPCTFTRTRRRGRNLGRTGMEQLLNPLKIKLEYPHPILNRRKISDEVGSYLSHNFKPSSLLKDAYPSLSIH